MNNRELKTIIKMFESSSLSRIKLERDDVTIELEKEIKKDVLRETVQVEPQLQTQVAPQQTKTENNAQKTSYTEVKAPLVGTYYEAPAPDQPPFSRVNQQVKKGDTLFIIEAMKVMNEITAPKDGVVKRIHVGNGDMVMYDQVVLEIE